MALTSNPHALHSAMHGRGCRHGVVTHYTTADFGTRFTESSTAAAADGLVRVEGGRIDSCNADGGRSGGTGDGVTDVVPSGVQAPSAAPSLPCASAQYLDTNDAVKKERST